MIAKAFFQVQGLGGMFKVIGHEAVVVLNGGLPAWESTGLEVSTHILLEDASLGNFKSNFQPWRVKN